ncbi:MAG: hydantoinase/oxoprolinase family protein [Gammaproteobacteria bacterium]|nr:hydantoinase/oxoprolinase family protein [Gammaproteobacteria bacterium]
MTDSWLGVDTGGTFTDFVYFNGKSIKVHKVLSTPEAPERAILEGIKELGINTDGLSLVHGSTVATNAVLEGKGVRTVYVGNHGFADLIQIGRQARAELYNLQPLATKSLLAPESCLEVDTRLTANGELLVPLDEADLHELVGRIVRLKPAAVAINLLFSFLDDSQEKTIEAAIPDNIFVSRSSDVLPEYKEYERGMTTVLNAYVGPLMEGYLRRLDDELGDVSLSIMQSSGGTIDAARAGRHAVNLLLSGPAGGLKGASYVAGLDQQSHLLTFDMGGTSTDVALIDGEIGLTSEGKVGDYPVAVPMVDMFTIGAGGGSIARVDAGGLLLVGPESAGASPGPACYGKGGKQATVTDANLVLGRLQPSAFLGGNMALDIDAARRVMAALAEPLSMTVEQAAEGIIKIANEHMVAALRVISVQRGHDPRDFTLVSFGGAGGSHVCALAEALGMNQALVPVQSGVLSALGMLVAAPSRELSQTMNGLLSDVEVKDIERAFAMLRDKALSEMTDELAGAEAETVYTVDLRYPGQSFTLNLPWSSLATLAEEFHHRHQLQYGHRLEMDVELVNIRVSMRGPGSAFSLPKTSLRPLEASASDRAGLHGIDQPVPVFVRDELAAGQELLGPALVVEAVATTFIAEGWQCRVDDWANLHLRQS